MKKILLLVSTLASLCLPVGQASASTVLQLTETFQSGATFSGQITLSDQLDSLLDVNGTLTVDGTGHALEWAWFLGSAQGGTQYVDGAYHDFMMDGTPPYGFGNYFVGLDWTNQGGQFALVNSSPYGLANAINYLDPMVSYSVSAVPLPPAILLMASALGLFGFARARQKLTE